MIERVKEPVEFGLEAVAMRVEELLAEVLERVQIGLVQCQLFAHEHHVLERVELAEAARQHEAEQSDYEAGVAPQRHVGAFAQLLKTIE